MYINVRKTFVRFVNILRNENLMNIGEQVIQTSHFGQDPETCAKVDGRVGPVRGEW